MNEQFSFTLLENCVEERSVRNLHHSLIWWIRTVSFKAYSKLLSPSYANTYSFVLHWRTQGIVNERRLSDTNAFLDHLKDTPLKTECTRILTQYQQKINSYFSICKQKNCSTYAANVWIELQIGILWIIDFLFKTNFGYDWTILFRHWKLTEKHLNWMF